MKIKFKEWAVSYYKHRKIGCFAKDFLKDMVYDEDFPKSCNRNYILSYLRKNGACEKAIEGFNEMWNEFKKTNPNKKGENVGYYWCVYGSIDNILSMSVFESETREEADYKARNPPKTSNVVLGTEVLVIEISELEYKKLNEMSDVVESDPRLKYDFITGLKGVLAAVKDGTVIKGGILEGFKGVHLMLDVYSKYKITDIFTKDDLAKTLNDMKKDRANTRDKLKREFMDILIRDYDKKLELLKANPRSTVFFT